MNSYKTFSSRTSPQIIQRMFDINVDGQRYTAHGVKGGNGEWRLEAFKGQWFLLGYASKESNRWVIYTGNDNINGNTLKEVIVAAFRKKVEE